jgi:hypothetical protein
MPIISAQFQWKHNNFEIKQSEQIRIGKIGKNHEQITFTKACDGISEQI